MTGIERIAAERKRQVEKEGYSPEHDDEHRNGELPIAAACYALSAGEYLLGSDDPWPWSDASDKRARNILGEITCEETVGAKIRLLEKAGALIAAEIDRLLRLDGE